jgi:hypothetical protein
LKPQCRSKYILQRLKFYKSPTSSLTNGSLCAINLSPAITGYKDFENKPYKALFQASAAMQMQSGLFWDIT